MFKDSRTRSAANTVWSETRTTIDLQQEVV